jgi:hypothetical protein
MKKDKESQVAFYQRDVEKKTFQPQQKAAATQKNL